MLREIFLPFVSDFSALNIFRYITFRSAYAAITAMLLCFCFGPSIISFLRKHTSGKSVREDMPPTHDAKSGIPTMGGILILLSLLISTFLWMDIRNLYSWLSLLAIVGFGLVGLCDDILKVKNKAGISARVKLIGQISVSLLLVLLIYFKVETETPVSIIYFPFLKDVHLDLGILYIPFGVFLLVAMSNAVNLTDGLDGLATGLVLMLAISFAILAYVGGRFDYAEYLSIPYIETASEVTIIALALAGACVGFLWFNAHPAEIMMGDTGSLAMGGLIGLIAMMIKTEFLLIICGGVFVMEVLSVIVQVLSWKIRKKRVLKMAPLHHHFELMGWAETKVVHRLWILGGLFAILGLSTLKIR